MHACAIFATFTETRGFTLALLSLVILLAVIDFKRPRKQRVPLRFSDFPKVLLEVLSNGQNQYSLDIFQKTSLLSHLIQNL